MQRLYVGNFDFEHELVDPRYHAPANLARLNAELATSWLAIARDGDYLWCPEPIEPSFFEQAAANGLPRIVPVMSWSDIPSGVELVPWGWTDRLLRLAESRRWTYSAPHPDLVRELNSRSFSCSLEAAGQCGLLGASVVTEIDQLDAALSRAHEESPRIVIKANWGMSARERIFIPEVPTAADRSWIQKRLVRQGAVFVEPWMQRREEIGIQIHVPQSGAPQLLGITPLICTAAGQYQGSWFTDPPNAGADFHERWQPAVEFALRAARQMQNQGYFGPIGIDALRYQPTDGSVHLRPLQDINARWTMGRLSLGWRRLLRPHERGLWRHFSRNAPDDLMLKPASLIREICSSPVRVGNRVTQHCSAVLFTSPSPDH